MDGWMDGDACLCFFCICIWSLSSLFYGQTVKHTHVHATVIEAELIRKQSTYAAFSIFVFYTRAEILLYILILHILLEKT